MTKDNPRYVVTGSTGYIGTNFVRILTELEPEAEVFGVGINDASASASRVPKARKFKYEKLDLADFGATANFLEKAIPEVIFHLAGTPSSDDWAALLDGNVKTTISVLESALALERSTGKKVRVVVVGSAAEYGIPKKLPVSEEHQANPVNRYGTSMACRTQICMGFSSMGCNVMVGRVFNPVGPGLSSNFALGAFARQIREMQSRNKSGGLKKQDFLTGNLNIKRDFIDIEDACLALIALAKHGKGGEIYNICSGKSYLLSDLLDAMLKRSKVEANLVLDKNRVKNGEVFEIVGSIDKIGKHTGWKPRVAIEKSLEKILD